MRIEVKLRDLEKPNEHGIYPTKTALSLKPDFSIRGKIALVDADLLDNGTRHPNLVIMKLSAYFKENDCDVRLIEDYSELYFMGCYEGVTEFDAVFIAKVFDYTKIDHHLLEFDNVYYLMRLSIICLITIFMMNSFLMTRNM